MHIRLKLYDTASLLVYMATSYECDMYSSKSTTHAKTLPTC